MVRKHGPDIRNGNWLFYDNQLLSTLMGTVPATQSELRVVSPNKLAEILEESEDIIQTSLRALHEHLKAGNPSTATSIMPAWLFTVKMAPAGGKMARGTVLHETSFDRSFREIHFSDPADFVGSNREYITQPARLGYSARLLLNVGGWNAVRDGGWLQVQHQSQSKPD